MKTQSDKNILSVLYRWPSLFLLIALLSTAHDDNTANSTVIAFYLVLLGTKFIWFILLVASYVGVTIIKREISNPFSKHTLSLEDRDNLLFWILPYQSHFSIKKSIILTLISTAFLIYFNQAAIGLGNLLLSILLIGMSFILIESTQKVVNLSRSNV